jgi:cytochrome c
MDMNVRIKACLALATIALPLRSALAEGDPERGARVFHVCATCHSTRPGEHLTGPSLAGVWGRMAGTAAGFQRYSEAMKSSGITWNATTLDKWLANPDTFIRGTVMMFPGLRNGRDRGDVIAYLKAVSEDKAPAIPGGGGMMGGGMMGGGQKADLRSAPAEGRVTSLTHCGDTYTVTTADGKVEKVWEFNLRLKTDSSDQGPLEGKPVIVGAGMRGDRASVVFAKPSEVSAFIGPECRDGKK